MTPSQVLPRDGRVLAADWSPIACSDAHIFPPQERGCQPLSAGAPAPDRGTRAAEVLFLSCGTTDGGSKQQEGQTMGYSIVALEDKILEMYPEIRQHKLAMNIVFDTAKDAYVVSLRRDGHELTTHLERADADDCMNGIKCVSLGIQVEQFIKNYELRR
jgi:hypothetical protein